MTLETSAIIEAIKAGSEKILFQLYEAYRNEFVNWATRSHQVSTEEAKDVFQDAMVGLYKNVRAGDVDQLEGSIKTYLFGIGKNIILNSLKRKGIEERILGELDQLQSDNSVQDKHEEENKIQFVKRIYKAIGSPCKEILELFYVRNFDMESIAIQIGFKNASVAKKKKYECIKAVEKRIKLSSLGKAYR